MVGCNGATGPAPTPLVEVSISPSFPQTLTVGNTLQFQASVRGSSDTPVRFESDKAEVAEVDPQGFLRAQSAGTATISAVSLADTSKKATVLLTVLAATGGVVLTPSQTLQVSANTSVNWSSDNPAVVLVSNTGLATAKAIGEASVIATAQADSSQTAKLSVQVTSVRVQIIHQAQSLQVGETLQLGAQVLDSQGQKVPDQRIQWSSSDWKIISVDENKGLVSAHQAGEATIYALSQAQRGSGASLKLAAIAQPSPPPGPPPPGAPIRILPLGDSITHGINWDKPYYNTYRRALWHLLKNAGYAVDFIGSMNKVMSQNCTIGVPNPDFDPDHEGHSGWRADQILNGVGHSDCAGSGGLATWLNSYTPDIALVHLGTNDMIQAQSVESTIAELEGIIKLLRSDNPKITILLAKIIPASDSRVSGRIPQLNAQIPVLVSRMNTAGSKVVLVDMTLGFDALTDLYDGIHPNQSGEQKIAQHWFNTLIQVLPK